MRFRSFAHRSEQQTYSRFSPRSEYYASAPLTEYANQSRVHARPTSTAYGREKLRGIICIGGRRFGQITCNKILPSLTSIVRLPSFIKQSHAVAARSAHSLEWRKRPSARKLVDVENHDRAETEFIAWERTRPDPSRCIQMHVYRWGLPTEGFEPSTNGLQNGRAHLTAPLTAN